MSFSFGSSEDAIIAKATPGASPGGGRDDGLDYRRKWAGLSGQSERPPGTLCRKLNPHCPWGRRLLDLLPPCRRLLRSPKLPALPPPCSPSLPPHGSGLGCGKDPPPHPARPAGGHFPSPGFSFLVCREALGRPASHLSPRLRIAGPSPRPSPAPRPGAPSAGSAPPARSRPGTILPLSAAPASRVFSSLGLRLFSRAAPQPCSSSRLAARQPRSLFPEPLPGVGIRAHCPSALRAAVLSPPAPTPWPPPARDSGSCRGSCCCCCCRRLLQPRPPTVRGAATRSTQVRTPGAPSRAGAGLACLPAAPGKGQGREGVAGLSTPCALHRVNHAAPRPLPTLGWDFQPRL